MAAQYPERRPVGYCPDGHQQICPCTGELGAIGTPRHVVERSRVALHDAHALSALHIPYPHGAIITATQQAAVVRREGHTVHCGSMPKQRRSIAAPLDVPEPNCLVKATTGQEPPIWTPRHCEHKVGVPCERLTYAQAALPPHVPQLDGPIETRAGQGTPIGGKGQRKHPVGMAREHPHGSFWLRLLHLPQSNLHVEASTGEQAPIGTPGQCLHRAAVAGERL